MPNSHSVVLWGLLRGRQIPFPLGQFRGLSPLVIEHVVRNLRTNLRTFFAGVNSLILSNSLTLSGNTMILLVKVYVLLSLVLETIGRVLIDNTFHCLDFIASLSSKSQILWNNRHLGPIVIEASTLEMSLLECAQIIFKSI